MAEETVPTETPAEPTEPKVIEDPVHDPVALGRAWPLGTDKVLDIAMDAAPETREGVEIPALESLTGEQQNRVEVLTGKRLQRPEPEAPPEPPAPPA